MGNERMATAARTNEASKGKPTVINATVSSPYPRCR